MNPNPDSSKVTPCDLCGGATFHTIVEVSSPRALRSDRVIVQSCLIKVACDTCGLVCNRNRQARFGQPYYEAEYGIALQDHYFYGPAGPRSRSVLFADWIEAALGRIPSAERAFQRILEIGAGAGFLLSEMAGRFPLARCEGLELSEAARQVARAHGRSMLERPLTDIPGATYDLIYAVAVVEHVPSPTSLVMAIRPLLKPGGLLVLIQPTQDVESYDILFVDHIHHFGTGHLSAYAAKIGCTECLSMVGYTCMPNFSLHVWRVGPATTPWRWNGPPVVTTCSGTARRIINDMRRLDEAVSRFDREGRAFGVFGLHEVFALTRAYSSLGTTSSIRCGLDDDPTKAEYHGYGFPVTTTERCREWGVEDVFLTMNRIYYTAAAQRLDRLGVQSHPVLS